ncbi:glycoside hydrolase family 16 protein [Tichowtungia aerotolerans]|uniref:Family 16 glycosylhydrolase n=1 Tax=Tichowtungia aerotolerans TaxID=2697043 RepID=A0A6P1MB79_9BACT|nr:glycoside hydrolase family 16 protein [Tichowtungia aerotolerans]QHI68375.1 family 16 glycosylhydrolase [Tichowtungia aerotolerans]
MMNARGATLALLTFALHAFPVPPSYTDFNLVFEDNFDATLDTNNWEVISDSGSWILSSRGPENIEVSNGRLILKTLNNPPEYPQEWSTGHLRTRWTQKYGYFEARFKYANHPWLNNAFWLFGSGTVGETGNQLEIDINEGRAPNEITQNYHIHPDFAQSHRLYPTADLTDSWHTYAAEWTPRHITYYFDDKKTHTVYLNTSSNFPRDVRFSTAVLEFLVNRTPDESRDLDGCDMEVDYVKVWQRQDNYTNAALYCTAGQSGLISYLDAIEAPSDGSAPPVLWYKIARTPNFGSGDPLNALTSRAAITNMTTDYWSNPDSAFGLMPGSYPPAISGSTGNFTTRTNGTVCFMFKTPETLNGFKSLFNQGYYGQSTQFEIGINGNVLRLGVQNGDAQPLKNLGTLAPETWYYVAMAWDLSAPDNNLSWYYGEAGSSSLYSGTVTATSAGSTSEAISIAGRKNTDYYSLIGGYFQNIAVYSQPLPGSAISNQFSAISAPLSPGYAGFTEFYQINEKPNSDPADDYDGDGQSNVYEYGLGGDPRNPADTGTKPVLYYGSDHNTSFYNVLLADPDADITYTVEHSENLLSPSWSNAGWNLIATNTTDNVAFNIVQHRIDSSAMDQLYVRLRISHAAP